MSDRPSIADASSRSVTWVTEWVPLVLLLGAAAYFVVIWSAGTGTGPAAIDIYQYYYPNMLAAVDRLSDGGRGLLWNSYQNCGQPFFGIGSVGLLYPANVFFLLLEPDAALRAVIGFNVAVAGISAYALCRELGIRVVAAFCGALAFELSNAMVNVTSWTPLVGSPYVWFPAVMLCCERILRTPSVALGLALAATVSVALLPGFPQTIAFMYQVVALRVLWEFASRRIERPLRILLVLALGLLFPAFLTAAQLLPAVESAWLSVRNVALGASEIGASLDWAFLRQAVAARREYSNPIVFIPFIVASAAVTHPALRRIACFYLATALLYFVLSFGPATIVYELYAHLPLASQFRSPVRFIWVTGFCLAVLTAFGADAVLASSGTTTTRWRRAAPLLALGATLVVFALFARGLNRPERILAMFALAGVTLSAFIPRTRSWAGPLIVAALALNLLWFRLPVLQKPNTTWSARPAPFGRLRSGEDMLRNSAPIFATLRTRMTPQDRLYTAFPVRQAGFGPKLASLYNTPSIHDYEPQPALRYARYFVLMRDGRPMESFNQIYVPVGGPMPRTFTRRLLDLAAARFVVVNATADTIRNLGEPSLTLVADDPDVRVYENPAALPRARFVPRVEVVPHPHALLERLALGNDDLEEIALVEASLPSGFSGAGGSTAPGSVEFLVNDPEQIVLRVEAPARGFLVLADQYFPGWTATVNGSPAPIVRANYAFRLVEVPAGTSAVEFRYAPLSVRVGAIISAVSILGAGALVIRARRDAQHAKTAVT